MKTNFRKLRLMIALGVINEEDYYHINVNAGGIILQGHHSFVLEMDIALMGFKLSHMDNGFVYLEKNDVKIILT